MKVLYVSPSGSLGGAERVLLGGMAAVRRAEPSADLHLMVCGEGPLADHADRLGVTMHRLLLPQAVAGIGDSHLKRGNIGQRSGGLARQIVSAAPATWRFAGRLRRAIQDIGPDLIHSNGIKTHLLLHLGKVRVAPIVWHVHDFYGSRPVVKWLLRRAGRNVRTGIAVSEAVADDLRRVIPGLAVTVIHNAIDVERFSPGAGDPDRLGRAAGLLPPPPDCVRVGLVATYARWKGQRVFLEAIARLSAALPARFYLVGGPIYQTSGSQFSLEELRAIARQLRVEHRVGFIGFQEDAAAVFRSLDVVVHASTEPEPFGLTIVEAMACGKAVIAAKAGGASELFHHDQDALGVESGDVAALAEAIGRLATDAACRRRLGENARRSAVQRFHGARLGPQLLAVYASALGVADRVPGTSTSSQPLLPSRSP
jgi:glycosyltransferase involved in cell wall biosynthesis